MNEIFFLLFAFFTVFLSIKLSYYVDYLNKHSKISGVFLAGIFLAGITSLPEFVTCFSAVFVGNYSLAIGDILGSNIFNIFMICVFDLFFIKKKIFYNMKANHNLIFILLLVNYLVLYLFIAKLSYLNIRLIGIPTLCILITYFYYVYKLSISEKKSTVKINDYTSNNVVLRLVITAILMVFSSIALTVIVNRIACDHPYFSSSFLGAIFLGVTTSLPEVITCYSLISIDSFDLALDDIIGSNFFNLLILAVADLLLKKTCLFSFADGGVITLIIIGTVFTVLGTINANYKSKSYYGFVSFVVIIIYLSYWTINFLG